MNTTNLTFDPTGWLEINYIETIQLPDVTVPEVPAVLDEDGNEVTPAVPETTVPGGTRQVILQCTSYHPTQLELIHADCATHGVTIEGDDAQAVADWVADYVPASPVPTPVPQAVTIRQARRALLAAGFLDDVEAAVASADRAAQIDWEYATEVRRDHPLIAAMQTMCNLTDADVDDLFVAASGVI